MTKRFGGTINTDIRDSDPDWDPYLQPAAPPGAPNVLYIVLDDVGFSAMEPWGGLIETPNIKKLAASGLTYTNWHTTGTSPHAFTGGTIKEAIVDVSGEHYVDLALEALAMLKRE